MSNTMHNSGPAGTIGRRGFLTLATCGLMAPTVVSAQSEWTPGKYMMQAVSGLLEAGADVVQQSSTIGWNSGICFMGAYLQPKGKVEFNLDLEGGRRYYFVGSGDNSVRDLDLRLFRNGSLIVKDVKTDTTPVVIYKPTTTERYTLQLELYDASVASFAALAIFVDGGFSVPVSNLKRAARTSINLCSGADELNGARYHHERNQWAVYGWVIRPQRSEGIQNIYLEPRKHQIVTAGDGTSNDLDAELKRDGRVISQDFEGDATPIVSAVNSGSYELTVYNRSRSDAAFVMTSILDATR